MVQYLRDLWAHIVVEDNVDDVEQVVFDGPDAVVLGSFFRRVVRMHLFEDTLLAQQAFKGGPDRCTATWTRGLETALRARAEYRSARDAHGLGTSRCGAGFREGSGTRTLGQA
ncbi:hypothetical protein [Streptomyces sp. NPDC055709]